MATRGNFFLTANSGAGVRNLYGQFTGRTDLRDLMLLQGGPGAGKSEFFARVGRALEDAGAEVEYFRCAGDPQVLDGLWAPGLRCGALDVSPPHPAAVRYPGAVDRCVDLGRFTDLTAAKAAREEIIGWTRTAEAAGQRAFRCLRAARLVELAVWSSAAEGMDWRRAQRRGQGILAREIPRRGREAGTCARRFLGTLSGGGYVWRFDAVDALCPRVYELQDSAGLARGLLERLRDAGCAAGWDCVECVSPEDPEQPEHLLLPGLGVAFVTSRNDMRYPGAPYRRVRLDALVSKADRPRARLEARMIRSLREEAAASLQEAREARRALAAVYRPYLDSDGVRALAALEAGRLLSWMDRKL